MSRFVFYKTNIFMKYTPFQEVETVEREMFHQKSFVLSKLDQIGQEISYEFQNYQLVEKM